PHPRSPPFPYTTLFRSAPAAGGVLTAAATAAPVKTSPLRIFGQPKMATLLVLGFSSGLPFYLTSKTLQAWMTTAKVDLATIGFLDRKSTRLNSSHVAIS